MATKKDVSEEINNSLNTEIEWHKLSEEDLEKFKELLDGGYMMEKTAKHYIKINGKDAFEKEVDDWYPGKFASLLM